jgi:hypothetical protein
MIALFMNLFRMHAGGAIQPTLVFTGKEPHDEDGVNLF